MDSSLLPEERSAPRPHPWRSLLLLAIPAAALAAGVGLQRIAEAAPEAGDPLLRWLCWSSAVGLLAGGLAGLARARGAGARLGWTAYGALAPWLVAGAVLGFVQAVRPIRWAVSERAVARCRKSGRALCSLTEFQSACAAGARETLGPPLQQHCGAEGCSLRWRYAGPWTPENYVAPGAVLCSVVTDAAGHPQRHALLAAASE
jgi:hypothetical protein